MKIETSLNHRDRAIQEVNTLYSIAQNCSMHSDRLFEKMQKIRASVAHCPQWVLAYVDGYERCKRDVLYRESLVFGGMYEGEFYSSDCKRSDYYAHNDIDAAQFAKHATERGHYWKETKKPYFVGKGL